jgi:hypothetical protein
MEITNPSDIFFSSNAILVFVKFAVLIIFVFYDIFALMIIRQVDLMKSTLITPVSSSVKIIAIIHALFAILLTLFAFWVL